MLAMTIQTVDLAQTPTKELASTIYFILTYCSPRQYTEWMKENLPRTSEEQIDLANALSLIWLWSFRIHMLGGAYILWAWMIDEVGYDDFILIKACDKPIISVEALAVLMGI